MNKQSAAGQRTAQRAKAAWVAPEVTRLRAVEAEAGPNVPTGDGSFTVS